MADCTLDPTQFFGRAATLAVLQQRIREFQEGFRRNVAVLGRERIGKSSLLRQVLLGFDCRRALPVYVEAAPGAFGDIARRWVGTLLWHALGRGEPVGAGGVGEVLRAAAAAFPRTAAAGDAILRLVEGGQCTEAFGRLLDLADLIQEEGGLPCVVLLDEFDHLAACGVDRPFTTLAHKILVQKGVMYVVTSSRVEPARRILREALDLLFGHFEVVELLPFTGLEADAFLRHRFQHLDLPDALRRFLNLLLGGDPFYLETVSTRVRERVQAAGRNGVTVGEVADALADVLLARTGPLHIWFDGWLERLGGGRGAGVARAVLGAVARGGQTAREISGQLQHPRAAVTRELERLVAAGAMRRNGEFYHLSDPLLGFWLQVVEELRVGGFSNDSAVGRACFVQRIQRATEEFQDQSARGLAERLAEVFLAFGDDLVQLNGRRHRLARFQEVRRDPPEYPGVHLLARRQGGGWACAVHGHEVSEHEVAAFLASCRRVRPPVRQKVLVALGGLDENARLLAKDGHVWLWEWDAVNTLMTLFARSRVIP